jgi:hypothetical protein
MHDDTECSDPTLTFTIILACTRRDGTRRVEAKRDEGRRDGRREKKSSRDAPAAKGRWAGLGIFEKPQHMNSTRVHGPA